MTQCIDSHDAVRYMTPREVMSMPAKTKKEETWRKVLPKRITALQRTMEKELRKRWDEATDLLPPAPRKALKRFTGDVDRARMDLRKRGDKAVADFRRRAERLREEMQKRLEGVIEPLTHRFDVATRSEFTRLQKRVHELERRIETHRPHSGTPA